MGQHGRHRLGQRGFRRKGNFLLIRGLLLAQNGFLAHRCLLHELVVEVEGNGEPDGGSAVGQGQLGQLGHIGRLDAEGGPVSEAHVVQRGNRLFRQVALEGLSVFGTQAFEMLVHIRLRGLANRVAVSGHGVVDVLVEQGSDGFLRQCVSNEGIGQVVLDGAQVDVGQRGLRDGRDGAGHAGQIVGQSLIDGDVKGAGAFAFFHQPQATVPLALVHRNVDDVAHDVRLRQHFDPGSVKLALAQVVIVNLYVRCGVVKQVVLEHRHGSRQDLVVLLYILEFAGIEPVKTEAIDAQRPVRGRYVGVVHDRSPGVNPIRRDSSGVMKSAVTYAETRIDEMQGRFVGLRLGNDVIDPLQVPEMVKVSTLPISAQRQILERRQRVNRDCSVSLPNFPARVDGIVGSQVRQLGEVVKAIAVHVSRLRDRVLLHAIAVGRQWRQVVGEGRRAVLSQCNGYRESGS